MPTKPKVGDVVFYGDPPLSYLVEDVDYGAKTADIRTTSGLVRREKMNALSRKAGAQSFPKGLETGGLGQPIGPTDQELWFSIRLQRFQLQSPQ